MHKKCVNKNTLKDSIHTWPKREKKLPSRYHDYNINSRSNKSSNKFLMPPRNLRGQQLEDVADQVEVPIPNLIPNFKFPAEGKYDLNMKYRRAYDFSVKMHLR